MSDWLDSDKLQSLKCLAVHAVMGYPVSAANPCLQGISGGFGMFSGFDDDFIFYLTARFQ